MGFCIVLLIKVFLALVLDLYSDEVFYWQASARPDVVEAMAVLTDPNAPNLGFVLELDSRNWTNGSHELAIEILNRKGITLRYGDRIVTVSN